MEKRKENPKIKDNPNSFRSISLKSLPGRKTYTAPPNIAPKMIIRKKPPPPPARERRDSNPDKEKDKANNNNNNTAVYADNQEGATVHERVYTARQNFQTLKNEIQNIIQENPDNNSEFYSILSSLQGIFKLIELEMVNKIGEDPNGITPEKLETATPNMKLYSKVFRTIDRVILNVVNEQPPQRSDNQLEKKKSDDVPTMTNILSNQQKQLLKLLTEENVYISKLDSIVNKYLPALQKDQLLNKLDENKIFSASAEILKLHQSLYNHIKRSVEDPTVEFGEYFLSKIGEFKNYQQYSINFTDATQCYDRLMKESKPFSAIVKQLDGKDGNFLQLLQRPLNRIEELIFQLEEYTKELSPSSKERFRLSEVRDQLQDLLEAIEQRESVADNLAKVMEVGLSIENLNENLVRPDRRYVYEGPLKLTPVGKSFSYVGQIYIHTVSFKDSAEDNNQVHDHDFVLTSGKEKFVFACTHQKEKQNWLLNIGKVIREVERTRKVFGVPLKVLMKREKEYDIPVIVEKSIHFIYLYGLDKEGLFRQTGRSTQIEKLKNQLNQGAKVFFSENMDVHSVAALFKQWLRELPEPLLTWESFPHFVAAVQANSEAEQVHQIKDIIEKLPKENRFVCQHMMKCLKAVCDNEAKTKMNPSNLAVVFAPNIIKNSDQMDFIQSQFENVNDAFKIMLENYDEIFSRVEEERTTVGELKKAKHSGKKTKKKTQPRDLTGITDCDQCVKEGNLFYNEDRKKWTPRYIILKPQTVLINRDNKSKKAKYSHSLEGATVYSVPTTFGKSFSFCIETKKELLYFAASSTAEQDEWISAVKDCLQLNNVIKP